VGWPPKFLKEKKFLEATPPICALSLGLSPACRKNCMDEGVKCV